MFVSGTQKKTNEIAFLPDFRPTRSPLMLAGWPVAQFLDYPDRAPRSNGAWNDTQQSEWLCSKISARQGAGVV
jgi:hypothetical protein